MKKLIFLLLLIVSISSSCTSKSGERKIAHDMFYSILDNNTIIEYNVQFNNTSGTKLYIIGTDKYDCLKKFDAIMDTVQYQSVIEKQIIINTGE